MTLILFAGNTWNKLQKDKKDVYNTKALVHKYLAGDIVWSLNEKFESMRVQRLEAQNTEVKQITTG